MDESRHSERRAFRRRCLAAFAASIALHCGLFALLFILPAAPPATDGRLAISLLGVGGGQAEGVSGPLADGQSDSLARSKARTDRAAAPDAVESRGADPRVAPGKALASDADAAHEGETGAGFLAGSGGTPDAAGGAVAGAPSSAARIGIGGGAVGAGSGPGAIGSDSATALAAQLLAAIEARKTYPDAARRRGTEGTVRLEFSVDAQGRLLSVTLAGSSGSALLDRAALDLASSVFPIDNAARREFDGLVLSIRYGIKRR